MPWVAIVAVLALAEFQFFGFLVGRARGHYGIAAPATSGHEIFDRTFRVHQNTLEQLIIFIPSLFMFAYFVEPLSGAGIGLVYVVARALYLRAYVADPASRGLGFGLTFLANAVLLLGGLAGAVRAAL